MHQSTNIPWQDVGKCHEEFCWYGGFWGAYRSSIKNGLVEDNSSSKKTGSGKKKEGEAQAVYGEFQSNYTPYSFYPGYAPYYPSINNVAWCDLNCKCTISYQVIKW